MADERLKPKTLPKYPYDGEIVIAGCAARLPRSHDIDEFTQNLYDKIYMNTTTQKAGRYEDGLYGNQSIMCAMPDIDKFDAAYFGMHPSMAFATDPNCRMLSERCYEAIIDAGESLETMKGSRTGVFVGALQSDSTEWGRTQERMNGYTFIGYVACHLANRLSYFFDFRGPSFTLDSACSSVLAALEVGMMQIRMGHLDYAIIGTSNLALDPLGSLTATKVGMLCNDGKCKAFDAKANGFVRADGNMCILLSKKALAKRSYCTVVHVRGNSDGFTPAGIAVPSAESQSQLLKDMYIDLGIDPNLVTYAEAHGPGTAVGDGIEVDAIAGVLCTNRKSPLLIGSVKTNMGHCEGSAGMASIIKCIIGIHQEHLPPNLHFETPNPNINSLFDGRVKVVTEATPFQSGLISISSFGVGGTNYNAVLRSDKKVPRAPHPDKDSPRLFVYGARTSQGAQQVLEDIKKYSDDVYVHALMEPSANQALNKMRYRLYTVLNAKTGTYETVKKVGFERRPVWLSFSGMGTQWDHMGKQMLALEPFRECIKKCSKVVERFGVDLYGAMQKGIENAINDPIMAFVGITSISMALYDLLVTMGIQADGMLGHSLGETACGYADGSLTAEEAILLSYWRGRATVDAVVPEGKMLAVGLTWEEAVAASPKDCVAACHNAESSVTMSGLKAPMTKLFNDLKEKGTFVREVNSLGKSYHSQWVVPMQEIMERELRGKIIGKKRSSKWLSTSVPEEKWGEESAQYASLDYFHNNLLSPVRFHTAAKKIPQDAMVIELAPNPLFQSILKRTVGGGVTVFSLMKAGQADNVEYFLNQMGQAYVQGMDMCPLKLCRPVQFPVPKSTPHVSPIVDKIWDHSVSWFVPNGELDRRKMRGNERAFDLDFTKRENEYIKDHIINGRTMCAAAGFLVIAWKTMASLRWTVFEEMNVVIKDVVFLRQRFLEPSDNDVSFKCRVQTNGIFEISENDVPLVRGSVFFPDEEEGGEGGERLVSIDVPEQDLTRQTVLSADEIRRSMRVHGWENKGEFDAILRANWDYTQADILWDGNWTPHIENILQCITQSKGLNSYSDIVSIGRIQIEPLEHWEASATTDEGEVHRMKHDQVTDTTVTGNIVIQNVEVKAKELPVAHEPFLAEKSEYVRFKAELQPSEEVQGYTSDCLEYTVAGLSKLVVEDRKSGNLPNRDDVVSVVSKRKCQVSIDGQLKKYAEKPNHGMAKFLQKIFQLHVTADFSKQVSELKENFQEELQDDDLLSILSSNNNLHPALQIVVDNTRIPNKAAMLEVDGTKSKLFENITEKVKRFPQLDASYTLSDSVDAKDLEKSHNLRYLNWGLSSPVEEDPEDKFDLVILKNVLHRQADLAKAWERVATMLEVGGFVLVQEITQNFPIGATFELLGGNYPVCKDRRDNGRFLTESSWLSFFKSMGFESVYQRSDGALSTLFLLRKPKTDPGLTLFVNTTNPNTSWLSEVQSKYKQVVESKDENARLWIYADTFITGAPGFLRSLRQESSSQPSRVRCIVKGNVDPTSKLVKITPGSEEFKALSRLDLCVSEYRDGHWGFVAATPIPTDPKSQAVPSGRAYLHVDNPGENASFHYLQLQATPKSDNWAAVYYAAVNDVDVAMATGQTGAGGMASENFRGQSGLGVEFVGRDKNGRRLMGCGKQRMIATEVDLRETVHVPIPDKMSMREAAAVFVSYGTAFYALVVKAKVHRGQSVLIHNGTGSIGQAAIAVALHHELNVFTTVDSEEKKKIIKEKFSQIPQANVSLTNCSIFEPHFLKATNGKGVDVVLSALPGDGRLASLRILRRGGTFLDLAASLTPDVTPSSSVVSHLASKSIMGLDFLQMMLDPEFSKDKVTVQRLLEDALREGYVTPINTVTFDPLEVAEAFKMAAEGSQNGKIVIKFREEEKNSTSVPKAVSLNAAPQVTCDPDKSYVIVGGIGGFGLDLAQWLVTRGCTKLVLTGSNKKVLQSGYLQRRIKLWQSEGVKVTSALDPCDNIDGARGIMALAQTLAPVGGVFLVNRMYRAGDLVDQSEDAFKEIFRRTVQPITYLDSVTRDQTLRSTVHLFVAFTSVVGSRGQAGQTNFAFANAYIDRVCKKRAIDGLPARTIQWGAVGDICLPTSSWEEDTDGASACGTEPQSLKSRQQALDVLMSSPYVATSSYVLPSSDIGGSGSQSRGTKLQLIVAKEFGLPDFSEYDPNSTLADLGMDSIMGAQVKTIFDNEYKLFLTTGDLSNLTIDDMRKIDEKTYVMPQSS